MLFVVGHARKRFTMILLREVVASPSILSYREFGVLTTNSLSENITKRLGCLFIGSGDTCAYSYVELV